MDSRPAKPPHDLVFLVDVDNTLLDNDAVIADLRQHLVSSFGRECQIEYWRIFEQLRRDLGYADYLGALQRYRVEHPGDPEVLGVSLFLLRLPFADRLYPRALDVIAHLSTQAPVVILSDGDAVFQPYKVERSGLWAAVAGRVLIYVHKERVLDDVERRFPSRHYVMVDDKLRILLGDQKRVGTARDHGVRETGPLRLRPVDPRFVSGCRRHNRAHRRPARSRGMAVTTTI